ncbi:hypothetical protein [Streptomyces bacillaris]|uniref:hypothetical protein n=1 Tax=Streptomyces bacillaris TaxID=68179 RepID=UPI003EBAC598
MNEVPTVAAYRIDDQLVIDCPYCGSEHRHGTGGPRLGDGDGHRVAHCVTGQHGSYILKESR